MMARRARNIALFTLVAVAFGFAVETAVMGLVLEQQGAPQSTLRTLTTVSVISLMTSVLACARALFVLRLSPPRPESIQQTLERRREKVLAA